MGFGLDHISLSKCFGVVFKPMDVRLILTCSSYSTWLHTIFYFKMDE